MRAYYNEVDPFTAAWLRELIKAGAIEPGEVDERDIREVRAEDLKGFRQCHFFAGIGGWSYALRLAGWPPDREVWSGSPPCQDASIAGSIWGVRSGLDGKRTSLVRPWLQLANSLRPETIFFENVPGIAPWIGEIASCLESLGYLVFRQELSAGDIGAPCLRRRVWMVADRYSTRLQERGPLRPFPFVGEPWRTTPRNLWRTTDRGNGRVAHGIPARVGQVRAFGNAIVPQVAEAFIKSYIEARAVTP